MAYSKWQPENKLPSSVRVWHMSTPLQFLIALALLVVVVFFVWFLFSPKTNSFTDSQNIPVIQAPPGPARIRPDSPGAPEIPYQDKKIYQEFTHQDDAAQSIEPSLHEQPEEPLVLREAGLDSHTEQEQSALHTGKTPSSPTGLEKNDLIHPDEKPIVMLTEKSAQNAVNIRLQPEKKPDGTLVNGQDSSTLTDLQNTSSQTPSNRVRLKRKPRPK